ncbi:MAG: hypothetical protein WC810_03120 [Janthinobacterium sp.]|jgi:hypothetical protein
MGIPLKDLPANVQDQILAQRQGGAAKKASIKVKPPLEKVVQLNILHYLKGIGAYAGKTKTLGTPLGKGFRFDPYTFRGFPDLTVFWQNKIYFIECKREGADITEGDPQDIFRTHCANAGITYILAHSREDVERIIK